MNKVVLAVYKAKLLTVQPKPGIKKELLSHLPNPEQEGVVEFYMHDDGFVSFYMKINGYDSLNFNELETENKSASEIFKAQGELFSKFNYFSSPGRMTHDIEKDIIEFTTKDCIYTFALFEMISSFLSNDVFESIYHSAKSDGYHQGVEKGFLEGYRIHKNDIEEMRSELAEEYTNGFNEGYKTALLELEEDIQKRLQLNNDSTEDNE